MKKSVIKSTNVSESTKQKIKEIKGKVEILREKIEGKAFNINCLPTVFTQKDYTFVVNEYLLNDESENKEKSND